MVAEWPDLAGRLIETADGELEHRLAVRVYFEDTDFSGFAYHASYVRWCERGRSDFLRLVGNDHQALLDGADGQPAAFVVRRMSLEFLKPAKIDEVLEVSTRVHAMSAAVLTLDQVIKRDDRPVFEARVEVVLISLAGKPQRLGKRLRAALGGRFRSSGC